MYGICFIIKAFVFFNAVFFASDMKYHTTGEHISEFFTIMGIVDIGFAVWKKFYNYGFHIVFLGIGDNPVDDTALIFIFLYKT